MMDLITLNEARRKRQASPSSFVHSNTAPPLTAIERPKRLSGGWAHFEELVFNTLEKVVISKELMQSIGFRKD